MGRGRLLRWVAAASAAGAALAAPAAGLGSLALHVSLFEPARLRNMRLIVDQASRYPFSRVAVFVHVAAERWRRDAPAVAAPRATARGPNVTVDVVRHATPEDPYEFAWASRPLMRRQRGAFDAYAYVEDDTILTAAAVRLWARHAPAARARNLSLGFVRAECWAKRCRALGRAPRGGAKTTELPRRLYAQTVAFNGATYVLNDVNPRVHRLRRCERRHEYKNDEKSTRSVVVGEPVLRAVDRRRRRGNRVCRFGFSGTTRPRHSSSERGSCSARSVPKISGRSRE